MTNVMRGCDSANARTWRSGTTGGDLPSACSGMNEYPTPYEESRHAGTGTDITGTGQVAVRPSLPGDGGRDGRRNDRPRRDVARCSDAGRNRVLSGPPSGADVAGD